MEKISYLGETIMRWTVGPSTFLALPERGARLMNWNFTLGDGSVRDVIYWPELKNLENFHRIRGGNPILFPFCGRSFDKGEVDFWRTTDGIRRPMPQHGVARQGKFKFVRLDARGFAVQFLPGEEAQAAYPYDYEFTVTYRFDALSLSCEFGLKNLGAEPIPWCAGHHFYFTLPWNDGTTRNDYVVRVPAGERLKHGPTGQLLPGPQLKADESIANPELIDTLHTHLRSREVQFGEKGKTGKVVVRLETDSVPPPDATIVTWTPNDEAPFYCVEPWMGPPNSPEHKRGLQWVRPGELRTFSVNIAVS
jgi:galactose mutarotase-like enzyme